MDAHVSPEIRETNGLTRPWGANMHSSRHYGTRGVAHQNPGQTFDNHIPYSPGSGYIDIHHRSIQSAYDNRIFRQVSKSPSPISTEEPLPTQNSLLAASTTGLNAASKEEPARPQLARASTTFYDRIVSDWWWWELFSWLVAFVCVAAIVSVLAFYDGKRQPDFIVPGITLNAYVSVFAAIAKGKTNHRSKAALILPVSEAIGQLKWIWFQKEAKLWDFHTFDSASRGPWGSTMLLATTRCRHLVSLGAGITILALAFEPFFQQVVTFSSRDVATGVGTVNTLSTFNPGPEFMFVGGNALSSLERSTSSVLQDAVAFRDNTTKAAPSLCPTGHCNWTSYDSLAVCHQCQDVSSMLEYICKNHTSATTLAGGVQNPCGWILNGSFIAGTWGYAGKASSTALTTKLVGERVSNIVNITWNSTTFAETTNRILEFYTGYVPGGDRAVRRNETAVLMNCLFHWCVKRFESTHEAGIFDEKTKEVYWSQYTMLQDKSLPWPVEMTVGSKTFRVGQNATQGLALAIRKFVADRITLDTDGQFAGQWNFVQVPPHNINPLLDKMGDAVTNNIRSQTIGTTEAKGKAWSRENFVEIRWVWVTLPGAVLLVSLLFVSATIVKSRSQGVVAWKSSSLAALIHGLTEEARSGFEASASPSQIEAVSQKMLVKLEKVNEGARLATVRFTQQK